MRDEALNQPPTKQSTRPWHLWFASLVALFLYAIGAYDFVLTAALDVACCWRWQVSGWVARAVAR